MIVGMNLTKEIKLKALIVYSDSQLVINQIEGQFTAKDEDMLKYLTIVMKIVEQLKEARTDVVLK